MTSSRLWPRRLMTRPLNLMAAPLANLPLAVVLRQDSSTSVPHRKYRGFEPPPIHFGKPRTRRGDSGEEGELSRLSDEFGGNLVAHSAAMNEPGVTDTGNGHKTRRIIWPLGIGRRAHHLLPPGRIIFPAG